MAKKATILKGFKMDEISAVDAGAGKGVSIEVTKRNTVEDVANGGLVIEQILKGVYAPGEVCEATSYADLDGIAELNNSLDLFIASARSIIADDKVEDKTSMLTQSFNEFVADLGEEADAEGVAKNHPASTGQHKENTDMTTAAAAAAAPATEEVAKQLKDTQETVAKQAAELAELRTEGEVREFVTKARAFDKLPIAADVLGGILHRVAKSKTTADDAKELDRLLTAANAAIGKSALFGETGSSAGATAGTDAQPSPIVKRAQERAAQAAKGQAV